MTVKPKAIANWHLAMFRYWSAKIKDAERKRRTAEKNANLHAARLLALKLKGRAGNEP